LKNHSGCETLSNRQVKTFKFFNEVVCFAINAEIEAVNFYKMLADFVEKPEMAEVLLGLA